MTTKKEIISIKEATIDSLKKNAVDLIDKSNKNFYALGDTLNTIKSLMEHSSFSDWIKNELDFSHNLANKYMKIAATLDEETAVKYKVRKSYALSCLSDDDRKDFLSRFDINNMSCDETEAEIRNFKLSKQATDTTNKKSNNYSIAKAKSFIKNIDTFKRSLSDKICSCIAFKDSIDDTELLENIENNKRIFAKLEELNLLITSSNITTNIDNTINYDLDDEPINEEYSNSDYYNDY